MICSIIFVPEYGARTPQGQTLQDLMAQSTIRVRLYTFDYFFDKKEIWPNLIRRGDELVEILKDAWRATVRSHCLFKMVHVAES